MAELDATLLYLHQKENSEVGDKELEKETNIPLNEELIALTERMKERKQEPLDYQLVNTV